MESPCTFCTRTSAEEKLREAKAIITQLLDHLPPSCANFRPEAAHLKELIMRAEQFIK